MTRLRKQLKLKGGHHSVIEEKMALHEKSWFIFALFSLIWIENRAQCDCLPVICARQCIRMPEGFFPE